MWELSPTAAEHLKNLLVTLIFFTICKQNFIDFIILGSIHVLYACNDEFVDIKVH